MPRAWWGTVGCQVKTCLLPHRDKSWNMRDPADVGDGHKHLWCPLVVFKEAWVLAEALFQCRSDTPGGL